MTSLVPDAYQKTLQKHKTVRSVAFNTSISIHVSNVPMSPCLSHQMTDLTKAPGNTMSLFFQGIGYNVVRPSFVLRHVDKQLPQPSCHFVSPATYCTENQNMCHQRVHLHFCLDIPTFSSSRSTTPCMWELPPVTTPPAMLSNVS